MSRASSIPELLEDLALGLPDVERREKPGGTEYVANGRVFASISSGVAAFRLRPEVARAAARTAGAMASSLGPDWIALPANAGDRYALDRAAAWFEHAARLAGETPSRTN